MHTRAIGPHLGSSCYHVRTMHTRVYLYHDFCEPCTHVPRSTFGVKLFPRANHAHTCVFVPWFLRTMHARATVHIRSQVVSAREPCTHVPRSTFGVKLFPRANHAHTCWFLAIVVGAISVYKRTICVCVIRIDRITSSDMASDAFTTPPNSPVMFPAMPRKPSKAVRYVARTLGGTCAKELVWPDPAVLEM
jgi:hypothetical protein